MATLVKTGIGDGQTLTPVIITELYDAFTGVKLFDNIVVNNSMKITHDGKVAISPPGSSKDTPYELTVAGTVFGNVGRFDNLIATTTTFVTSSTIVITGSNVFGNVGTDLHHFTGSLRVSGSAAFDTSFLTPVAIGKTENTHNIFEISGSATISNAITASDITISQTGSFGNLSISGDLNVIGNATINGNLTFGNTDTDSVAFSADINSNFIPDVDSSFNIGSPTKNWKFGYIEQLESTHITASGNISSSAHVSANSLRVSNTGLLIDTTVASPFISASILSTGSFGFLNSYGDIRLGGDLISSGTGSFRHIVVTDGAINVTSASIGRLDIDSINLNNQTGSENSILTKDSGGNLFFDYADRTSITGKNISGGTLDAGTPVFISTFVQADVYGVNAASNVGNTAIGILQNDLSSNETGSVILSGVVRSIALDTSGFSVGNDIFLGEAEITNVKPSAPGVEIQKLGKVLKSSATNGEILLLSAGSGESLDTLKLDHIFIGSGSLTENLHLSGALDRARINNVTAIGTGSFGHFVGDGSGLTNVFEQTVPSASISTRITKNEDTGSKILAGQLEFTNITASNDVKIDGKLTAIGDISSSLSSTASFGLLNLSGIEINPDGVSRDQVLKFNGTNFVPAAPDDTFVFTIADFDMNDSTTPQLIGTGSWKTVGALGFTASYNNGPPDGFEGSSAGAPKIQGYVDGVISSSYDMFPLSSSFTLGTNPMAITFPPDSSDDIRFRLFASAGSDTDNEYTDQRIYFFNQFVYGDSSKSGSFTQSDIRALAAANTITSNDTTRTITVSIGASNYLNFAHRTGDTNVTQVYCGNNPNRLTVAMDITDATTKTPKRETVSYLNTAGYTENFFVYSSKEQNIDAHSTTFVTSTSSQIRNYIYFGTGSSWTNNEASVEGLTNKSTTYDDGSITGNTLSVGTFTSQFVIVAIPNRYGDNDVNYQFKDNSTNLPFAFDQQSDVTITNAVGFQEDYSVYRSTNQLTMTNATVLIDSV